MRTILTILTLSIIALTPILFYPASAQNQSKAPGQNMWAPHGHGWREEWTGKHMQQWHRHRMERHWRFMHGEVPEKYRKLSNPLKPSEENIKDGARLYKDACAQCHGKRGMGDGETAKNLRPSPALLAYLIQRPVAADSYLIWTISEGGVENKTDMPAFKGSLSTEEIWKIILYMRADFPELTDKK